MNSILAVMIVCLPLKSLNVTSPFGFRVHPLTGAFQFHAGVDLRAKYDTVYAVLNGTVKSNTFRAILGRTVILQHGKISTVYGHLSRYLVNPGDSIFAGQAIAISGANGRVTAPHLHFGVYYEGRYLNPLNFLYELIKSTDHEQKF